MEVAVTRGPVSPVRRAPCVAVLILLATIVAMVCASSASAAVRQTPASARPSTATATASLSAPAGVSSGPLSWSSPLVPHRIENVDEHLQAVSCASKQFCAALSDDGFLISTDPLRGPSSWSATQLPSGSAYGFSIACPSAQLCIFGDYGGDAYITANPSAKSPTWTGFAVPRPNGGSNVSTLCLGDKWCLLDDQLGDVLTSTNPLGGKSAWHRAKVPFRGGYPMRPVNCRSKTFCWTSIPHGGTWVTTTPLTGGWHKVAKPVTTSARARKLSCPVAGFCAKVTNTPNDGEVFTSKSSRGPWSGGRLDGFTAATGGACPMPNLCLVVDSQADVLRVSSGSSGVSWRDGQIPGQHTGSGIACISAKTCVAGAGRGELAISTDAEGPVRGWHATKVAALGRGFAEQISCASTELCVIGTSNGKVLVSTDPAGPGRSWHERTHLRLALDSDQPPQAVEYVSCPTTHLCFAGYPDWETRGGIGGGTLLVSTNPSRAGSWHASYSWISGVVCPSKRLCVASVASSRGQVAYTTPGVHGPSGWHYLKIPQFLTSYPLEGQQVACLSTSFCMITGHLHSGAGALAFSSTPTVAGSWQVVQLATPAGDIESWLDGIWCGSAGQCVTATNDGRLFYGAPSRPS